MTHASDDGAASGPKPRPPAEASHPPAGDVPEGMITDLAGTLTYGKHLQLDQLLSAQRPVSESDHELLFIVIHQAAELWMKLLLHEIRVASGHLQAGAVIEANRRLARGSCVIGHMLHSWDVLATLTPNDFLTFR